MPSKSSMTLSKQGIGFALIATLAAMTGCDINAPTSDDMDDSTENNEAAPSQEQRMGAAFQEDTGTTADVLRLSGADKSTDSASLTCATGISDSSATEWELLPGPGSVASGTAYSLRDSYGGNYLKYGVRDSGINLVWSSSPPSGVSIERAGGGIINYGEAVAIKVTGGGYLKYQTRSSGINLVWSSTPLYEWEVDGGTIGTALPRGTRVRLFNRTTSDNMVYCQRPTGINLAWAKDCTNIPFVGRVRTDYCP